MAARVNARCLVCCCRIVLAPALEDFFLAMLGAVSKEITTKLRANCYYSVPWHGRLTLDRRPVKEPLWDAVLLLPVGELVGQVNKG